MVKTQMATFTCSKCEYSTKTKGNLVSHISKVKKCEGAEIVSDGKTADCPICKKSFETEKYLSTHLTKCKPKRAFPEAPNADMSLLLSKMEDMATMIEKLAHENSLLRIRVDKLEKNPPKDTSTEASSVGNADDDDAEQCRVIHGFIDSKVSKNGIDDSFRTEDDCYYISNTKKGEIFLAKLYEGNLGEKEFSTATGDDYKLSAYKDLYIYKPVKICKNKQALVDGYHDGRCADCIKKGKELIEY